MSYYAAKFAREAKEKPLDWVIIPVGLGRFELVEINFKVNDYV